MNTYIALRPFIGQQIIEALKKLPYTDVCGLIGEINDAMNYPVQLNWNTPVEEEKKEQKRPIGFIRCTDDEEEVPDIEEPEENPSTIICKSERKK